MEIKVGSCNNCPFLNWDIDYESMGHTHLAECILDSHLNNEYGRIKPSIFIGNDVKKLKTPTWCPLKRDKSLTVEFVK